VRDTPHEPSGPPKPRAAHLTPGSAKRSLHRAEIRACTHKIVRYAPDSGTIADITGGPSRAKLRHFARSFLASYSITSSARTKNDSGRFNPINFAVLRLTVRKNRVGCSIGKSAGLAPLKILSTRTADRRRKSLIFWP